MSKDTPLAEQIKEATQGKHGVRLVKCSQYHLQVKGRAADREIVITNIWPESLKYLDWYPFGNAKGKKATQASDKSQIKAHVVKLCKRFVSDMDAETTKQKKQIAADLKTPDKFKRYITAMDFALLEDELRFHVATASTSESFRLTRAQTREFLKNTIAIWRQFKRRGRKSKTAVKHHKDL